ncbi:MAG: hypothetical protein ACP5XB_24930 [Isosphaeraceae bacterium]
MRKLVSLAATFGPVLLWFTSDAPARALQVDLTRYDPACGVTVKAQNEQLDLDWPLGRDETGRLVIDLRAGSPLFREISIAAKKSAPFQQVLEGIDPTAFVVVGERKAPVGRPPEMSEFNVFFDSPANRPFRAYRSHLEPKQARVSSQGQRATVTIGELTAGPFAGDWQITVFAGSPLIQLEAVVTTHEEHRAFLHDMGLMSDDPPAKRLVWVNGEGKFQRTDVDPTSKDHPLLVRWRTIVAATHGMALTCFPPPHQYFFPRDLTDNQSTVWYGRNHRGLDDRFGFGIRQTERGGGVYVPWFNAPPGTAQRLGMFLLLSRGTPQDALKKTLRYTHDDRFPHLDGYHTLASHFHMAIAMAALEDKKKGRAQTTPDFVKMFQDMGVDMVHLAEFHGDGHPGDPGPLRLPEMKAMFDECRRLSDNQFLLIPGEEANVYLGLAAPGRHPGHWLYLFPRPVYWTMKRAGGQPFREDDPRYGTVYHVGNRADMLRLLEVEDGLAWTAHARIKASSWAPDAYRHEDFFLSDHWLGAAWKAMPADLSQDRLGRRVLDLLDDMANWGTRKHVLGEVDVFKLDHTHELYVHMNINYLRLDRVPTYQEGWQSVLDALRQGRFFVTTGEVLIPEFRVDEARSGDAAITASLRWTFPLAFAELVSGDGRRVFRQRIDLSDTRAFGEKKLEFRSDLKGRTWTRLEVWDVACNGAFTQPVWLGKPEGVNNGR